MRVTKFSDLTPEQVFDVPINWLDLEDKTFCIRTDFEVDALTSSMKTLGQIHPVVVRLKKNYLQIIAGWRRCLALRKMKSHTIRVQVADKSDLECRLLAASENLDQKTMTAAETFNVIDGLLKDGANAQDLMKRFEWGKSYSYAIQKLHKFPLVCKALQDGRFSGFSTAVELVEHLKDDMPSIFVGRAIDKVCDGSWPVKDINHHLKRETEFGQRAQSDQTGEPDDESQGGSPSSQVPFKSRWKASWSLQRLLEEQSRFREELAKIQGAIREKRTSARTQRPLKRST